MSAKVLVAEDWVRLAASRDAARPALCGLHVRGDGRVEATDGYRLHQAMGSGSMAAGLWDAKTGRPVEAQFPNVDVVIPQDAATHTIADVDELVAVCQASVAYHKSKREVLPRVTFRVGDGYVAVNAQYLLDALKGVVPGRDVQVFAAHGKPVRLDIAGFGLALIMTIRDAGRSIEDGHKRSERFDVSDTMRELLAVVAA